MLSSPDSSVTSRFRCLAGGDNAPFASEKREFVQDANPVFRIQNVCLPGK